MTKMCERMETRTVCRISTSISTTKSWCQHSQNLDCDRAVAQALPEQPGSARDRHQCRDRKQHCDDGVDDHLSLAQIVAKVIPQSVFDHLRGIVPPDAKDFGFNLPTGC